MKRTLILGGIAAVLATAGMASLAHDGPHGGAQANAGHEHQTCTPAEGKSCPAEGKGGHQHGSGMQGRMQGMGGMQGMQGQHEGMMQNRARMAEMHARMHGGSAPARPGNKEEEHKH
jgi:TolA-binding protein